MKLSHFLYDNGFIQVLGQTENIFGKQRTIKKGEPITYNTNNSTIIVCDENGLPWVNHLEKIKNFDIFEKILKDCHVEQEEIWVPFSNDGGETLRYLLELRDA